jgi:FlaA1/EpsC-like NDP-sugar epimerase
MLGGLDDLPTIIAEHGIRHVFVTFCQLRDAELVGVLRRCDRSDCEIYIVPRLFELGAAGSTLMDHLWGIPLVPLRGRRSGVACGQSSGSSTCCSRRPRWCCSAHCCC